MTLTALRSRAVALAVACGLSGVCLAGPAVPVPGASAAGTWSSEVLSSSEAMGGGCAEQLFVGVRGSGEPAPFGPTIASVRDQLSATVPLRTTVVFVEYPAVSPHTMTQEEAESQLLDQDPVRAGYADSVARGVANLTELVMWSAQSCPKQKVVLAGFSQGAQVITTAMGAPRVGGAVTTALLLGNPSHFPGQNVRELDQQVDTPAIGLAAALDYLRAKSLPTPTTDRRTAVHNLITHVFELQKGTVTTADLAGTLQRTRAVLPAEGYATTFSVCQSEDMVCDAAPAMSRIMASSSTLSDEFSRSRTVHNGYGPVVARQSLTEMARILNAGPSSSAPAPAPAEATTSSTASSTPASMERAGKFVARPWVAASLGALAMAVLGLVGSLVWRRFGGGASR
ncbi:hypothetical protein EDD41_2576 [Luteococcus japonicus]|uniref:Cutinase n=1 Tax=Luteococcus japonicus TaxID=33984 RepID=A0A3N1ZWT3_9ACTN|nr:cutinase family protein [Luteococcus japonicus]ROR55313.1 hypothetical protein EDD41_2576 [Luteococcus japonicus]